MSSPRRRRMRTDSASTNGLCDSGSVGVNVDQAAFRLGHDFLGDDKAVAVTEFGVVGGCDQFGEIVTRTDLADVVNGDDLKVSHSQLRVAAS